MAEKTGAGGDPQEYNPDNGQYGGSGGEIKKAVDNYKPNDIKAEVYERTAETAKKHYSKAVDSAVMNKYSSVKRQVDKFGYAIVRVFVGDKKYWVKINKSKVDFDYDILRDKKND